MSDVLVNVVGPVGRPRPVQLPGDRPLLELTERLGLVAGVSHVSGVSNRDGTVLDGSLPLGGRIPNRATLRVEGKLRRDAGLPALPGPARARPARRRPVAILAGVGVLACVAGVGIGYGLAGGSSSTSPSAVTPVAATSLATKTARAWMAGSSAAAGRVGPKLPGSPDLLSTVTGDGEVTDRFLIVSGSGAFGLTVTVRDTAHHRLGLIGPATASSLAVGTTAIPQTGRGGQVADTGPVLAAWAKAAFGTGNPATVGEVLAGRPKVTGDWAPKTPAGTVVLQVVVPLRTGSAPSSSALKTATRDIAAAEGVERADARAASVAAGRADRLQATSTALARFVVLARHPTAKQRRAVRDARRAATGAARAATKASKAVALSDSKLRAAQDTLKALQAAGGTHQATLTASYDVLVGSGGVKGWAPAGLPLEGGTNS